MDFLPPADIFFDSFIEYRLQETDQKTHWYTVPGEPVATCDGYFKAVTPDNEAMVTVSYRDNTTRLCSLDGNTTVYAGIFYQFTPNGEAMVLVSKKSGSFLDMFTSGEDDHDSFQVVSLTGESLSQHEGELQTFTSVGNGVLVRFSEANSFGLYRLDGREVAQFQGSQAIFTANGLWLVVTATDYESVEWHDLSGQRQGRYNGGFVDFTPDGNGLVTYSQSENMSYWLNFSGEELARYEGRFDLVGQIENVVIATLYDQTSLQDTCALLHLDGSQQFTYEGRCRTYISEAARLVVDSNSDSSEEFFRLVSLKGGEASINFRGNFETFTPDSTGVVTTSSNERKTYLYTLTGEVQAVYEDWFKALSSDGEWIITYYTEDYDFGSFTYRIFNRTGEAQAVYEGRDFKLSPGGDGSIITAMDGSKSVLFSFASGSEVTYNGAIKLFLPGEDGIITHLASDNRSRWYSQVGQEQVQYEGEAVDFNPGDSTLLTYSSVDQMTRRYALNGDLLATYAGEYVTFISNQGGVITMSGLPSQ